ncbi:SRPBCC domain-containing protein [Thalassococcus lentus]|uniref:SRPBCC domain-containing protein n=1 Tax=Thalassococcus lentus TaxID=1210524 RepID=A0ABT4XTG2_9RHOB|nr:SRPBCC domain-containing protein [Thalassococcus lentus]MDA7425207.1 SRPBCC domain-containing protein [Thalassococcus lentus]
MTQPTVVFQMNRHFTITKDRLWHLLTDPHAREIWGAPSDEDTLTLEKADFREGGQERHRCGPAEEPQYSIDTHWYHIEAPQLACFSETVSAQGFRFAVSLVRYHLAETDSGTDLVVDVAVAALTDEDMRDDFQNGWTSGLDRLAKLIADKQLS